MNFSASFNPMVNSTVIENGEDPNKCINKKKAITTKYTENLANQIEHHDMENPKDAVKKFGIDSVFLPNTPIITNWMGRTEKTIRREKSAMNHQPNYSFGKSAPENRFLLPNTFSYNINGKNIFTFNNCSFNAIFHVLREIIFHNRKIEKQFEDDQKEKSEDIVEILLNWKNIGAQQICERRSLKFIHFKNFNINDPKSVSLDCDFNVEFLFEKLVEGVPSFKEYSYCHECKRTISISGFIKCMADSISEMENQLSSYAVKCVCDFELQKFFRNIIVVSVIKKIDFDTAEKANEKDLHWKDKYLEVRFREIPEKVSLFNEIYKIEGIISILENAPPAANHYISFYKNPLNLNWFEYNDLKKKPLKCNLSKSLKPVLFILTK